MKLHETPFLGDGQSLSVEEANVVVLPVPYDGGISFGSGTADGPAAILHASAQVEFYDTLLEADSRGIGIATLQPPDVADWETPEIMDASIEALATALANAGKFVLTLGGDHSIAPACVRSFARHSDSMGVIQIDAHADLRDRFAGSRLSHACAMARIRETTPHTLQLGIRSMCSEERDLIDRHALDVFSTQTLRAEPERVHASVDALPESVYVTLDVDGLDGSVVWATGTPEPGGLLWHEITELLRVIFEAKHVVGMDIVELAPREGDINSPYAVARIAYYAIGLHARYGRASRSRHPNTRRAQGPLTPDI